MTLNLTTHQIFEWESEFNQACKQGDVDSVRYLLATCEYLEKVDLKQSLFMVCKYGRLEVIKCIAELYPKFDTIFIHKSKNRKLSYQEIALRYHHIPIVDWIADRRRGYPFEPKYEKMHLNVERLRCFVGVNYLKTKKSDQIVFNLIVTLFKFALEKKKLHLMKGISDMMEGKNYGHITNITNLIQEDPSRLRWLIDEGYGFLYGENLLKYCYDSNRKMPIDARLPLISHYRSMGIVLVFSELDSEKTHFASSKEICSWMKQTNNSNGFDYWYHPHNSKDFPELLIRSSKRPKSAANVVN